MYKLYRTYLVHKVLLWSDLENNIEELSSFINNFCFEIYKNNKEDGLFLKDRTDFEHVLGIIMNNFLSLIQYYNVNFGKWIE